MIKRSNASFIVITIFVLLAGITRTQFGTDIPNNIELIKTGSGDLLFDLSSQIFRIFVSPSEILNIFLISSLLLKITIFHQQRLPSIPILIIFCLPLILAKDFGTIRQGLSISVSLFAIFDFLAMKRVTVWQILTVLLASGFHGSAIPVYIISLILFTLARRVSSVILFCLVFPLVFFFLVPLVGALFASKLGAQNYFIYKFYRYLNYPDAYAISWGYALSIIEVIVLLSVLYLSPKMLKFRKISVKNTYVSNLWIMIEMIEITVGSPQLLRILNLPNLVATILTGCFSVSSRNRAFLVPVLILLSMASSFVYMLRYPGLFNGW